VTTYVILEYGGSTASHQWREADRIDARSDVSAIKAYGQPGTFVAIPLRSWRPRTVQSEQTVKLTIT
jgi:hypothetical protein